LENIKVSVIIPVYNAEDFLDDCLTTIGNQTLKEIEIICVNDGSKDNSLDILRKYQKMDSRIQVIDQPNSGAGAARNAGLAVAKGEYLSFLDSDDFYEEDMLEQAYAVAKKNDADVCVFYADLYDNSIKKYRECTWAFRRQYFKDQEVFNPREYPNSENIFRMFNGWPWDKIYKREFIEEQGLLYQNLRTTNDMYFVFMALAKAERIITLDKCLIHQRVDVKSSLSRTREKSWDCFYLGLQAMHKELIASDLYSTYEKAFLNWTVNFSLWQLNSMKGSNAYCNIYKLLRDTAFEEFGVTKAAEKDFYNKNEYNQFCDIMKYTIEEALINQIDDEKNRADVLKNKNDELTKKIKTLENKQKKLTGELNTQKKENETNIEEIKKIKESTSYKVGFGITAIPRKIKTKFISK
jgi:glycosyltransferase involved in cell wall biosynthesis